MDKATTQPTPTSQEVWVAGDPSTELTEILIELGREYNLDVWFNGVKIHLARKEADDHPKPQ